MRWHSNDVSLGVVALVVTASLVWTGGCDDQPAGASGGTAVAPAPENPPVLTAAANDGVAARPKLKPGARTKVLARAGDRPYDKTFDDLRFEMDLGARFRRSMLTKEIEALDGSKIRIRGFILPSAQNRGIRQFVLVRDNQECCFGPGAALYDCIFVEMAAGKTVEYTRLPIAVEGVFNIREFVVDGKHMAIYQMDAETLK